MKPQTIDEYLAGLSPEKRAALQKVRRAVHAAAPGAEERTRDGFVFLPGYRRAEDTAAALTSLGQLLTLSGLPRVQRLVAHSQSEAPSNTYGGSYVYPRT